MSTFDDEHVNLEGETSPPPPSSGSALGSAPQRRDFPHLTDREWRALERMAATFGAAAVTNLLRTLPPEQHHGIASNFLHLELKHVNGLLQERDSSKKEHLKLTVSKYSGGADEALLRWFVELETAMDARLISNEQNKVAFAMSCLDGKAKTWAYGLKMHDSNCFPTYEVFKKALRDAYEPPKCEFRARLSLLRLHQGKNNLQWYTQRARYLVSSIVEHPVDMMTQVAIFLAGLNDGPIKTQLFREYPETLEEAISRSLQEDFSHKQAKLNLPVRSASSARPPSKPSSGAEPMDIGSITSGSSQKRASDKTNIVCRRCQGKGHYASDCRAPAPVAKSSGKPPTSGNGNGRRQGGDSKNVKSQ